MQTRNVVEWLPVVGFYSNVVGCLPVAGFYSYLVECLPVDQATWAQFRLRQVEIFSLYNTGTNDVCLF